MDIESMIREQISGYLISKKCKEAIADIEDAIETDRVCSVEKLPQPLFIGHTKEKWVCIYQIMVRDASNLSLGSPSGAEPLDNTVSER